MSFQSLFLENIKKYMCLYKLTNFGRNRDAGNSGEIDRISHFELAIRAAIRSPD